MNKDNAKDYLPLVQAMAEGKVIQILMDNGKWEDVESTLFSENAEFYRVKPEPKVIWVNRYMGTEGNVNHPTLAAAKHFALPGAVPVCYIEVIE